MIPDAIQLVDVHRRIDVRIDFENIFIGLVRRGWRPDVKALVGAVRSALSDIGEIVTITAYADWSQLARRHGGPRADWQRDLTLAGGESRYVVSKRGKNIADMRIVDDVHKLLDVHSASDAIGVIAVATMDRDFRPMIETAKRAEKRVIVLGLDGSVSEELKEVASEVRYLDPYLKFPPPLEPEDIALIMRVAVWMQENHWDYVYPESLEKQFKDSVKRLRKLIANGWFRSVPIVPRIPRKGLEPSPESSKVQAAFYLINWIPDFIRFHANPRRGRYVDTDQVARKMSRDPRLVALGVGRSREAAQNWLLAAANADLIVEDQRPDRRRPGKLISTWALPEDAAPPSTVAPRKEESISEVAPPDEEKTAA